MAGVVWRRSVQDREVLSGRNNAGEERRSPNSLFEGHRGRRASNSTLHGRLDCVAPEARVVVESELDDSFSGHKIVRCE